MNKRVDELASLIMYNGPKFQDVLNDAMKNKNIINTNKLKDGNIELIIESSIVYKIKIVDKYIYDLDGKLIKQSILINKKERIIFDKYKEVLLKLEEEKENIA